MSKAVLISIRPKWVEKIASGEKTIEVRKTRPKLQTPFKCYIYCTLPKYPHEDFIATDYPRPQFYGGGKVVGEFTCDRIYELAPLNHVPDDVEKQACLTREEIVNYLKGTGYGRHISALRIYDTPKELIEFHTWKKCKSCSKSGYESTACIYDENCMIPAAITKAPQSWCYVEAMKGGGYVSTFPERLRKLRESERPAKSMRVKAELIGIGHDTLRKYETGENEPALSQLKLIANHYHVSLDELAWDEGERESKPL